MSCAAIPSIFSSFVDTFVDFCINGGLSLSPEPESLTNTISLLRTLFPQTGHRIAVGDIHSGLHKDKSALRLAGLIIPKDRWSCSGVTVIDIFKRSGKGIKLLHFVERLREAEKKCDRVLDEILRIPREFFKGTRVRVEVWRPGELILSGFLLNKHKDLKLPLSENPAWAIAFSVARRAAAGPLLLVKDAFRKMNIVAGGETGFNLIEKWYYVLQQLIEEIVAGSPLLGANNRSIKGLHIKNVEDARHSEIPYFPSACEMVDNSTETTKPDEYPKGRALLSDAEEAGVLSPEVYNKSSNGAVFRFDINGFITEIFYEHRAIRDKVKDSDPPISISTSCKAYKDSLKHELHDLFHNGNFGRSQHRSKENPKILKQLSRFSSPNKMAIPINWKQQWDWDIKIKKSLSNVGVICKLPQSNLEDKVVLKTDGIVMKQDELNKREPRAIRCIKEGNGVDSHSWTKDI